MVDWIANATVRTVRRVVVGVAGGTIVLAGIGMLVMPGPGIVTIGIGLALLSLEFAFAQRWLRIVRARASEAADQAHIPRRYRIWFPIGGVVLGAAMMILPGFVSIVSTPDGRVWIRKERFSYAHSWTSVEKLQQAAANGDPRAHLLLQSLERRRTERPPAAPRS